MSLTEERVKKFEKVIKGPKGDFVILTAQYDQDSVGAGCGIKLIIETIKPGSKVRIYYCGKIGNLQNQAVFDNYNLDGIIVPIEGLKKKEEDNYILVDSSSVNDSRLPEQLRDINPLIIIDHHRGGEKEEGENQFYWIEENIGAASTLVGELALAFKVGFNDEDNVSVAALLALGIYSDTRGLLKNYQKRDVLVYGQMTEFVEKKDLHDIVRLPPSERYQWNLYKAIGNMERSGSHLVTGIGFIHSDKEEYDIALIAEHLRQTEGVTMAVVWAISGDIIKVSARSEGPAIPLNSFLKEQFSKEFAGAKQISFGDSEGGVQIKYDLGPIDPAKRNSNEGQTKFVDFVKTMIKEVIFD